MIPQLPAEVLAVLMPFAPLFTAPTFSHFQLLFLGAVLAPGQRTVTSCLRATGLEAEPHFTNFHRLLNRAQWEPRHGARLLFFALLRAFLPQGPILLGLDDTIERRRGAQIKAKGIYRDPVRSSDGHFVKCSGLRWLCLMLLVPVPLAKRVWALPFLSVLCPSLRYFQQHRAPRGPKKLTDWARQMLLLVRRWLPERPIIVVADAGFAVMELLADWQKKRPGYQPITAITRLRLDAALFEPAPTPQPKQTGRPRKRGRRLPTLAEHLKSPETLWQRLSVSGWYNSTANTSKDPSSGLPTSSSPKREVDVVSGVALWSNAGKAVVPIRWVLIRDPLGKFPSQALLSTDVQLEPEQIISYFVQRWQVEVTFHETRQHLGVETQRQWNDKAIERTTPLLLALFSLVTLSAHQLARSHPSIVRRQLRHSAWYDKRQPTFSDALAWVRRATWMQKKQTFLTSLSGIELNKAQLILFDQMTDLLSYTP